MKNSLCSGSVSVQSASLPVDDPFRVPGVGLEPFLQPVPDNRLHQTLDLGVPELRFGLPFELWFRQLQAQHRGQAFAHVVAGQGRVSVLQQARPARVVVDRPRQRRPESRDVRASLGCWDRVDIRQGVLQVGVVVLQRHVDLGAVALLRRAEHGRDLALGPVDRSDEFGDAAGVLEHLLLIRPFVAEANRQAFVQIRDVLQAFGYRVGVEIRGGHDLGIRLEGDAGAGLAGRPGRLERGGLLPAGEPLPVLLAVALNFDLQPFGQRVDDGHAHPVQAAGDLVPPAAELAAGVQGRQHHLDCRLADFRYRVNRNPGAVVGHRGAAVRVQDDVNLVAPAGQRFIDRVVDHLVQQVVQPVGSGAADVHRGTPADAFETFEDLDLLCGVGGRRLVRRHGFSFCLTGGARRPSNSLRFAQGVTTLRHRKGPPLWRPLH